ncbi:MAG: hypothetical protein CO096_06170 [Armatimonadetes bacterium CG_4_9_14_3_um_filter_66_14]|nr:MAG: hypothetical protein CO096_06170 [Armatimonadetes bacterium CG_4_9_14_3_um_filter_66_14]
MTGRDCGRQAPFRPLGAEPGDLASQIADWAPGTSFVQELSASDKLELPSWTSRRSAAGPAPVAPACDPLGVDETVTRRLDVKTNDND